MKAPRPITIAKTDRIDFRSDVNGRRYSLSIGLPFAKVPERGFPVLYVLEGNFYFATAVEAARACAPQVLVVGIGYPDDEAYLETVLQRRRPLPPWLEDEPLVAAAATFERLYDLSLPTSDEALGAFPVPGVALSSRDVGGLAQFLKIIEAEVKPRIDAFAATDLANQAIFGHSLGGLAVLHALFTNPNAFRTFIAASPSIWWDEKAVLAGESKFAQAVEIGTASPRVLITMGSEEETANPHCAAQLGIEFEQLVKRLREARMVENARELTQRLKALRGSGAFEVEEYALFAKQDHGISVWPALGRAISFAFPP